MNTKCESTAATDEASSKYGAVGKLDDGRSFVQFERRLAHSIDKVWAAITAPEELEKWFPGFQLDLKEGGRFDIWFGGECEGPAHVTGTVTRFEPPRILECGSMRWELEPDGAACILKFTDILHFAGPRSKAEFTNSVLGGWHRYLDALEEALAGHVVDPQQPEIDYATIDVPGRE
ncbi:MAG: SRPBCC family protein [Gammaproteobacteria bacterium]|nr:SRPBCC family protein [Gammaproteobacteria bacterium]